MSERDNKSRPFLLPVESIFCSDGLLLKCGEEQVKFCGKVFSAACDTALHQKVMRDEEGRIVVTCRGEMDGVIEEYCYFDGSWEGVSEITVAKTRLTGIGVFLRTKTVSFFLSLDFPYSKITEEDNRVTIGCDPKDKIRKGENYYPHTLTIGAAALRGEMVGQFDYAEIEAFSEYILSRMPKHFRGERPIFSSTCITNRMTDVREGRIFYSMYDNPTLTLDPETLKEEVRLCAELGIEYYQVFEDYFDWEEDGSSERNLRELVQLGKELGVRVGDYMTAIEGCCWHYNYHDRKIGEPSMYALEEGGERRFLCYGDERVVEMLRNTILESVKRNEEEMICLDGNAAVVCYDEAHGHNPGSLYAHIRGLVTFMSELNAVSPYFMTWSNAGNWVEFMPKLLWYNQNVYLTDPHPREYSSALNNLKYYGDCRREQMVTVHNKYFVPYSAFTNCEYYAFRHSRVSDYEFFEYSFLQGLAVTPNICLGELRTFLERTPSGKLAYVKNFMKKWMSFIRENIDCWKHVLRLGDLPGAGANEAYAHINGNRGFICFVNQNQCAQQFTFRLDTSIGLCGVEGERWLLSEIYPGEYPIAEQSLPGPLYGEEITLTIPAYSVRFIKIEPWFAAPSGIRLYGINGKEVRKGNNVLFDITAECGKIIPAALWCDNGNAVGSLSAETVKTVPKYWFLSSISEEKRSGNGARFAIHMPRDRFERELSVWKTDGDETAYRLNQSNSDFCGGYLHNLYREDQHIVLTASLSEQPEEIENKETVHPPEQEKLHNLPAPPIRQAAAYECELKIPFIEWPAMSNGYGDDEVIELVFRDDRSVQSVKAYLDGREVPVYAYRYPPAPEMKTYYVELVGEVKSGSVSRLRVEILWTETEERIKKYDAAAKEGAQVVGE